MQRTVLVGQCERSVIMFGLDLPAGSFPLRSQGQEECKECCMRRILRKAQRREGGGGDDVKEEKRGKKAKGGQTRCGKKLLSLVLQSIDKNKNEAGGGC